MTTPVTPPAVTPADLPVFKRKGSLFRTVKAVMWSFVGLRARGDYEKDVEQLNPVHIVIVGLVGVVLFVGSLILLATWVVGK
jgi:Protein of unknown function (DUF2970)